MKENQELRDADGLLRITSSKKPVIQDVDPNEVVIDRIRNRRDEAEVYEKTYPAMARLMESIKIQGIIPGYWPILHRNLDSVLEVLIGHCRLTACIHLGMKSVPCAIISGLTEEQKLMVIYGSKEEHEGAIGEFKEVVAYMAIGLSRKAIAQKLNWRTAKRGKLDTNLVQFYAQLAAMPVEIIEAWKNQERGKETKFPKLTSTNVGELYKSLKKDEDLFEKTKGVEGSVTADGPELRQEIAKLRETGKTTEGAAKKNGPSVATLKGYASSAKNHLFKQWILGISGVEGIDFGPILSKIDSACDLVFPNPKPADAPKTVEEVFTSEPETTSEPEPEPVVTVVSEGVKTTRKNGKRS